MSNKDLQEWEYEIRYESPILNSNKQMKVEHLNVMGEAGWELVSWFE